MGIIWKSAEKDRQRPAGTFARPLLVHYHIYKNAGTSVDRTLSESFGGKWASFEGAPEKSVVSNNEVADFASANPEISAISSHKARPFPAVIGFFPILFLRNPIDRARSMYGFAKRDPAQVDHALARDLSFKDYVDTWLRFCRAACYETIRWLISRRRRFASRTFGGQCRGRKTS